MYDRYIKCKRKYLRDLIRETQSDTNGYPNYRRRKPDDDTFIRKLLNNQDVEIDNRWVVPYCPLLSKMSNGHINVELCDSIASIQYLFKYITKGSAMAIFILYKEKNK